MTNNEIATTLGYACIGVVDLATVRILAENMAFRMSLTKLEMLDFVNHALAAYL